MLAFSLELTSSPNIMQTISREGLCMRTLNREPRAMYALCATLLSNKTAQLAQHPLRPLDPSAGVQSGWKREGGGGGGNTSGNR